MIQRRYLSVLLVLISLTAACGSAPTPTPVPVAAAPDTATPTATLWPTETVPPSPTATAKPSDTPTGVPSATPTATPTRTASPAASPTKRPLPTSTRLPATATQSASPTPAPASTGSTIPAAVVQPFSPDLFIETLDKAHAYFIKYLSYHGKVSSGNISVGSCYKFFNIRSEWASLFVFSDVPEAWAPLHTEYRALRDQVFVVTDPINQICGAGRGSIGPETDRQILDFLDSAQNRLYEIGQQARALK